MRIWNQFEQQVYDEKNISKSAIIRKIIIFSSHFDASDGAAELQNKTSTATISNNANIAPTNNETNDGGKFLHIQFVCWNCCKFNGF